METNNFLGIWMDYSNAHLMEFNDDVISLTIESEFKSPKKLDALSHSESGTQHKALQQQEQYYKKIGTEILKFSKVLLFGPTDAKLELYNHLLKDHHFNTVKFGVNSADKMTSNEKIAYVKNYFTDVLK